MMYDHEKSDLAIVAVKPTNKAGQPAAELVEPRAWAEGNVSQQSTGRAQYRGTVSQALERIRNFVRISRRAVTHPRWEPYARIGLVRICAGGASNSRPYRESDTHIAKLTSSTQRGPAPAKLTMPVLRYMEACVGASSSHDGLT
jgi:hypothetical protein